MALWLLISILVSLLPIVVIVVVVRAIAGRRGGPGDAAAATRRFFIYLVMVVTLVMAAEGLRTIVRQVLSPSIIAGARGTALAGAVSAIVVGAVAFVLLWRFVRPRLAADPEERDSAGWIGYLTVVVFATSIGLVVASVGVLRTLFGLDPYGRETAEALSVLVVYGPILAIHLRWTRDRAIGPGRLAELPALSMTLVGLVATVIGLGGLVTLALDAIYDALFGAALVTEPTEAVLTMVATLVAGAVAWAVPWFGLRLVHGPRTTAWNGYVLLFPIFGAVVALLGSLSSALFLVLEWFLGSPEQASAASHFRPIVPTLAAAIVAGAVFGYHRAVFAETEAVRDEPRRLYDHLLAFAGLGASVTGLTILLVALLRTIGPEPLAASSTTDVLLGAITALVVGGPLWWRTWTRIERIREADPAEAASPTRRTYLVAILGIAGVTAIGTLLAVLQPLLEVVFGARSFASAYDAMTWPLATLVTTGAVAWYHLQVLRRDRPEALAAHVGAATGPREIVLVAPDAADLATRLRERFEARVQVIEAAEGAPASVEAVVDRIEAAQAERVLVLAVDGHVDVVPLRT